MCEVRDVTSQSKRKLRPGRAEQTGQRLQLMTLPVAVAASKAFLRALASKAAKVHQGSKP